MIRAAVRRILLAIPYRVSIKTTAKKIIPRIICKNSAIPAPHSSVPTAYGPSEQTIEA
jgi:hypothetical protein